MFWYDETCLRPTAAWMRPPADEQSVCRLSVRALPRKRFVPAAYTRKCSFRYNVPSSAVSSDTLCPSLTDGCGVSSSVSSSQLLLSLDDAVSSLPLTELSSSDCCCCCCWSPDSSSPPCRPGSQSSLVPASQSVVVVADSHGRIQGNGAGVPPP